MLKMFCHAAVEIEIAIERVSKQTCPLPFSSFSADIFVRFTARCISTRVQSGY